MCCVVFQESMTFNFSRMAYYLREVFLTCIVAWLYLYGAVLLAFQLLPCSICFGTAVPILLFLVACFMKVPTPEQQVIEEILGTDPMHGKQEGKFFLTSIAHRGAGLDAPENSLSAFRECAKAGCVAVEFDLMLTKDEVPIIFHDATTDRLTGHHGVVKDMTWAELQKLDISTTHHLHDRFKGERICLLEDAIKLCLELDLRMFLDIKSWSSKMTEIVLDMYQRYPKLYQRAFVSSFNPFVIYSIRRANPSIGASLAYRPYIFSANTYSGEHGPSNSEPVGCLHLIMYRMLDSVHLWFLERFTHYFIGVSAILLMNDIVTADALRRWRERNERVIVWSVNQPIEKKFLHKIFKVTYMTDTMIGEVEMNNSSS